MTRYLKLWLAAFSLATVTFAGCTNDEDLGGRSANSESGSATATASSTSEERSSFCNVVATKSCATEEVQFCDKKLNGTNSAYVQALERCMSAASSCTWQECAEKALPEIAPGYPNVPVVTECKDKNLECVTKYTPYPGGDPGNSLQKRELDEACESLVVLDAAGQARAKACAAKDCDAFAACISEVSIDID